MAKNAYRQFLRDMLQRLGPDWKAATSSVIYRSGGRHLIQCISCQTSNFDRKFVPATFVQVLAHPADTFTFNFGGRLQNANAVDFWVSGDEPPPIDELAQAVIEQGWPSLSDPLTLIALENELDRRPSPKNEPHYAWCAGLVYALNGRVPDAHRCFEQAITMLQRQQTSWHGSRVAGAEWVTAAIDELQRLESLLGNSEQFAAHCTQLSDETATRLKVAR